MTQAQPGAAVPEITADDVDDLLEDGALLVDVREQDEWDAGHAPAALHIPMREVASRVGELETGRQVLAICRAGSRSRTVAEALIAAGYDAVNVTGGMQAWQSFGLAVVTDGGADGTVI